MQQLSTEFELKRAYDFQGMCPTQLFQVASPAYLMHEDKPLTMRELNRAEVYDFDFKYGQKCSWNFNDELAAIDLSMMQSPKLNFHRRVKRRKYPKFRFVPSLEDIKENELFETQLEHFRKVTTDLISIHEERALSRGVQPIREGRRHHHKKRHLRCFYGKA